MKALHMVVNAHIDPVWQWDIEEGISATLATFQAAADLAEEFDYIFCHNEALLYEWVKDYRPALFKRIQKFVADGKWKIMGGWYLQPDCNLPAPESIIRQILRGQKFFRENFGVKPHTSVNVDSFGHSVGLVQILAKSGYKNYMHMRPGGNQFPYEDDLYRWRGLDGSEVIVWHISDAYNSEMGTACAKVKQALQRERDVSCVFWGVGNHGGGPSRKDLREIQELMRTEPALRYSDPDTFFNSVSTQELPTVCRSLAPCMVGCYTSLMSVKQMHRKLENIFYSAEKLCALADRSGGIKYPSMLLREAEKALLFSEFHDILPGSCVKNVEESALRLMGSGISSAEEARRRAVYAFLSSQERVKGGSYAIFVLNTQPYAQRLPIISEFQLEKLNMTGFTEFDATVNGKEIPCQQLRPSSTFHGDWRKKVAMVLDLPAFSVVRVELAPKEGVWQERAGQPPVDFSFKNSHYKAFISGKSGLLERLSVKGREYLSDGIRLILYSDDADSWGMLSSRAKRLGERRAEFQPMTPEEVATMTGVDDPFQSFVRVIEDGSVLTKVETLMKCGNTRARLVYTFYRDFDAVDLDITLFFNGQDEMIKLVIPTTAEGKAERQIMGGREAVFADGSEQCMQKFVLLSDKEAAFAVLNDGVYGFSALGRELEISLVRGAVYCCHPIAKENDWEDIRPLCYEPRYYERMDQGEHRFGFRFVFGEEATLRQNISSRAQSFNDPPLALSCFPDGTGGISVEPISSDNSIVELISLRKEEGVFISRWFNNTDTDQTARVFCGKHSISIKFKKFEIKTLHLDEEGWSENERID